MIDEKMRDEVTLLSQLSHATNTHLINTINPYRHQNSEATIIGLCKDLLIWFGVADKYTFESRFAVSITHLARGDHSLDIISAITWKDALNKAIPQINFDLALNIDEAKILAETYNRVIQIKEI